MIASVFLQSVIERLDDLIARVQVVSKSMSDRDLNQKTDAKHWSAGQIFEHMLISTDAYLPEMKRLVGSTNKCGSDLEVVYSWFGRFIIKAAGPSGNAPVPKKMVPGNGPHSKAEVDRWLASHLEISNLAKQSYGLDLSGVSFKNPIVPLFKMNLGDAFEILVSHAERHVSQIENLQRSLSRRSAESAATSAPVG
jgi:hypothetical protein